MRQTFTVFVLAAGGLAGCGDNIGFREFDARSGSVDGPVGEDGPFADAPIDAPPGTPDADIDAPPGAPDAAVDASSPDANTSMLAPHLVITEVDTDGNDEFVEIYNPTGVVVNLRSYHLSDANNYWRLPENGTNPLTLDGFDFIVRFPVGATIAAGEVITVATDAVGFETSYAVAPTYAIQEVGNAIAMDIAVAPTTGTINPNLTNAGEMVALFRWTDTDLVRDVDLVIAGNAPTAANAPVARDGVAIDGPDAGAGTTPYQDDGMTIEDMQSDVTDVGGLLKTTYKRISFEGPDEVAAGGNGLGGHDETTEQLRTTWDSQLVPTSYTAGTPGTVPVSLQ